MAFCARFINHILDIFFPPLCLACERYLSPREKPHYLCARCFHSIPVKRNPVYVSVSARDETPRFVTRFLLSAATSYALPHVRALIREFKYARALPARLPLALLLEQHLERSGIGTLIERRIFELVPVPLHPTRLRERGFNQAAVLANEIAIRRRVSVSENLLRRVRATTPQALSPDAPKRRANVRGCFELNPWALRAPTGALKPLRGRRFALIDDVCTSGATLSEAVRLLRSAGAREVICIVVAQS
ncbi:MAG: ComF family protein [Candidatus Colwellbacteria bacterium]|nr:ComF family protein [Candidatus Colwellbacteria bacterium]